MRLIAATATQNDLRPPAPQSPEFDAFLTNFALGPGSLHFDTTFINTA